ncbi:hypothetical protein Ancab_034168 [Ancistrocladus abbreviatus]
MAGLVGLWACRSFQLLRLEGHLEGQSGPSPTRANPENANPGVADSSHFGESHPKQPYSPLEVGTSVEFCHSSLRITFSYLLFTLLQAISHLQVSSYLLQLYCSNLADSSSFTMADEELMDPKKCLEDRCKSACVKALHAYQACQKRIDGDESGHKHCTGQYFDYWYCVDGCVAPKLFSKLK